MLMLVQVCADNAMKKTAVYKWVKLFFSVGGEDVNDEERYQDGQQETELKKTLQKFAKFCLKIVG